MEQLFYPAIFHPEDVGFSVQIPDIDGCFTEGDTLTEAYANSIEAIGINLEDISDPDQFPEPSNPVNLSVPHGDFIALIEFDMRDYKRRHSTKSVKKTLTIPSWLNAEAEEHHINFSSVLQAALKEQLGIR